MPPGPDPTDKRSREVRDELLAAALAELTETRSALRTAREELTAARAVSPSSFQSQLLDAVGEAVIATDRRGVIQYWNRAAERLFGWSVQDVTGLNFLDIAPTNMDTPEAHYVVDMLWRGDDWTGDFPARRRDGSLFPAGASATAIRSADGEHLGIIGIVTDLTERWAIEAQLRESQKLEAVGRLAGGIAHDFNNLLTVIQGNAGELAATADAPARENVAEIQSAASRAADLTRQLLAFSRQQVLQPRIISLDRLVHDMQSMLQRLVRADIQLTVSTAAVVGMVRADPSQMSRVVMNLVANARDAMPSGGKLAVSIVNEDVAPNEEGFVTELKPGPYVMLTVADTGMGMDAHTVAHMFEPFFTTKSAEQGTGLGLATVFGIVTQSGGHIEVESAPGRGTVLRIYLPRVNEDADTDAEHPVSVRVHASNGQDTHGEQRARDALVASDEELDLSSTAGRMVLLCEDENAVRRTVRMALEREGFSVLEAAGGDEALRIADSHSGVIDLLLTDVVMPGMSGSELVVHMRERRPGTRVLLMSGYANPDALGESSFEVSLPFLAKPFTLTELGRKVRDVLST